MTAGRSWSGRGRLGRLVVRQRQQPRVRRWRRAAADVNSSRSAAPARGTRVGGTGVPARGDRRGLATRDRGLGRHRRARVLRRSSPSCSRSTSRVVDLLQRGIPVIPQGSRWAEPSRSTPHGSPTSPRRGRATGQRAHRARTPRSGTPPVPRTRDMCGHYVAQLQAELTVPVALDVVRPTGLTTSWPSGSSWPRSSTGRARCSCWTSTNVYANARNRGRNPRAVLDRILDLVAADRIGYVHVAVAGCATTRPTSPVAGHDDTHTDPVPDALLGAQLGGGRVVAVALQQQRRRGAPRARARRPGRAPRRAPGRCGCRGRNRRARRRPRRARRRSGRAGSRSSIRSSTARVLAPVAGVGVHVGDVQQQQRAGAVEDLGEELRLGQLVVGPVEQRGDRLQRERHRQLGLRLRRRWRPPRRAPPGVRGTGSRCPTSRRPARTNAMCSLTSGASSSSAHGGEVGDPGGVERLGAAEREPDAVRDHRDAPLHAGPPPLEVDLLERPTRR